MIWSLVGGSSVAVFEAHDVLELGRRDLEDGRVLDRARRMDCPGDEAEGRAGPDPLGLQDALARRAELQLGPPFEHVPGLVLDLVELQAQRLARVDDEQLPRVAVGHRKDQLVAPGLVDLLELAGETVDAFEVRRRQMISIRHGPAEPTTTANLDWRRGAPRRDGGP